MFYKPGKNVALAPGVEFLDYLLEVLPVEVGVYFGGGNRLMAQHFLHSPQIGPSFNKMCGKGMTESVRADAFLHANFFCQVFDNVKYHYTA